MSNVEKFAPSTGMMLRADIRGHEAPPYTTLYVRHEDYTALEVDCRGLMMLVAEAAYKAGNGHDRSVASDVLRDIVNSVVEQPALPVPRAVADDSVVALKAAEAIDCCESAIKHLLHNIKASGKRIDLGLAPSSANEALRRVNQYRAMLAAPSPSREG